MNAPNISKVLIIPPPSPPCPDGGIIAIAEELARKNINANIFFPILVFDYLIYYNKKEDQDICALYQVSTLKNANIRRNKGKSKGKKKLRFCYVDKIRAIDCKLYVDSISSVFKLNKKIIMEVTIQSVSELLGQPKRQFIIPVYQRNYNWSKTQCSQLLQDIKEVGCKDNAQHFIGSTVLIKDDRPNEKIRKITVIDGQQRLTTIAIIWIALYHYSDKNNLNSEVSAEEIKNQYLVNTFAKREDDKLKLKTFDEDNSKALRELLKNNELVNCPDSQVKENYKFYANNINENNFFTIYKGLEKLHSVNITLSKNDNPQRIFESLNSTGLSLSQADLIRNYILMDLEQEEQNDIYYHYWHVIENNTKLREKKESKLSEFIRDFLILKTESIPNINNVYQVFKKQYSDANSINFALEELRNYSIQYNKIINPNSDNESNEEIRKEIEYINDLEITVAYPFLMQVYHDYENNTIDELIFVEVLKLIQAYSIRRYIVDLPTNSLNKVYKDLYKKIEIDNYLPSLENALMRQIGAKSFPRNEELKEKLKTKDLYNSKINSKNSSYILQKIEEFDNKEPVKIKDNKEITIEHIFPQKPCAEWKDDISQEDYNLLQNKYLHTIGNLSLTGGNQSLGNARFIDKRDKKGYGYKASRIWLNKSLQNFEKWGMEEFNQRFEVIAQHFIEVWPQPKERVSKDVDLVNIFDAEAPRRKNLETVMFMGQEIKKNNITEYYVEIIRRLFEKNADYFFSSSLANIVKLTRINEKVNLRQAASISNEYCIETSLNSSTKFIKLKEALEYFGLEDELFIKYKANEESEEDE